MLKIKEFFKKYKVDIIVILCLYFVSVLVRFGSYVMLEYKDNKDSYRDEENIPYFHDMDSYYYASTTKVALKSDKIWDVFTEANPYRVTYDKDKGIINAKDKCSFLPFISALLYKFTSLFSNISLNKFLSILSPLLYSLAVIPAYIFVRRKTNVLGGITAGVIVGLNVSYMYYTGASSMDTDVLLVLFPLIYITTFLEMLYSDKRKNKIIMAIISVLSLILLLITWGSSEIYLFMILGISFLLLILYLIKNKFNIKRYLKEVNVGLLLIMMIIYIIIFIILVGEFNLLSFFNTLKTSDLYPDAGLFVSELSDIKLFDGGLVGLIGICNDSIINRCGGIFGCILLLFIIVVMIYELFKNKFKKSNIIIIFLLIWFGGSFISVFNGVRFFKFLIIPLSLILGLGIGNIYHTLKNKEYRYLITFLIVGLILMPYSQSVIIAFKQKTGVTDELYNVSKWINENTSKDALIVSWWDNGYYYEYIGERKTLSDGGTYNGRYYYYMSKAFITEDINVTKGIFNMLATSGLKASYLLEDYLGDTKSSAELLVRVVSVSRDDAKVMLKQNTKLNDKEINEILKLTHQECKEDIILVISSDMLGIMHAIGYYGNYDFIHQDKSYYTGISTSNAIIYDLSNVMEYEGVNHLKYFQDVQTGESYNIWKLN